MHRQVKTGAALLAIVIIAWLGANRVRGQQDQHAGHGMMKLGKVHFETSCSAAVGQEFDRAMALLHSFEFPASIAAFQAVLKGDSSCGIADWGIAMATWGNPVSPGCGRRACSQTAGGVSSAP